MHRALDAAQGAPERAVRQLLSALVGEQLLAAVQGVIKEAPADGTWVSVYGFRPSTTGEAASTTRCALRLPQGCRPGLVGQKHQDQAARRAHPKESDRSFFPITIAAPGSATLATCGPWDQAS